MLRLTLLALVIIVVWINILPYMMPHREKNIYSDTQLREMALGRGMKPIPKDFTSLAKLYKDTNNSLTPKKIALGKQLYFDTLLSSNKQLSCATCHMLGKDPHNTQQFLDDLMHHQNKTDCMVCHIKDQSGSDRLASAIGYKGETIKHHLNTLTILNASLAKYQMWDGSLRSSLESIKEMITDSEIMGMTQDKVLLRLQNLPEYRHRFQEVFEDGLTFENVLKVLDSYVKTLVTRSAYDRFLEGDNDAMSQEAKRGFRNFIELGCKGCHTGITVGGQTIQKFPTRNYNYIINVTGSFSKENIGRDVASFDFNFQEYQRYPFKNKGGFLGKEQKQLFRVPILRNVTKTSPYFHNGAVFDLREAIYIMGKYQLSVELSETQIDEIVAFFESLEGEVVEYEELR